MWSYFRNQRQDLRVDAADIKFELYTNTNTEVEILSVDSLDDLIKSNYYNRSVRNVFTLHGWTGTILRSMSSGITDAIFASGEPANIFVVDWSIPAGQFYPFVVWSMPSVGQIIANYIDKMIDHFEIEASNFILVGYSVGAHLAGIIGSNVNGTVGQIVGLEPVWIMFSPDDLANVLDKTDAAVVHIAHTTYGFGQAAISMGHADFYFNGGQTQPGCEDSHCSHDRSHIYYAESILSSGFKAVKCSSYEEFKNGDCDGNEEAIFGGYPLDER